MRLVLAGVALGTALAAGASRVFASVFLSMNTYDAPAYGAGILRVTLASARAAWRPGGRAARIDPVHTLRYD